MLHSISVFFLLLGLFSHTISGLRSGEYCFGGCELALNYVGFNDTNPALSKKVQSCKSALRSRSLYLCIDEYCTERYRSQWLDQRNDSCVDLANEALPPFDIIRNYTSDDRAGLRRLTTEDGLRSIVLAEEVIPDEHFFERAFETLDAAFFEYGIHKVYGFVMYYFWAVVVSLGISSQLIGLIRGLRHQEWQPVPSSESDIERLQLPMDFGFLGVPIAYLKRRIIIPATFGYRCSQNVRWCTIPPRIQSITIFSFVFLNILICCINYRLTNGNFYWPLKPTQLMRYVSDRTGIISLVNFPMIWLFGTRNNVLMWLTSWGFGAYNNFHRWIARVATLQAVVHSIGYTVMIWERGGWGVFKKDLHKHYFWNGELATVSMVAICVFSVYGLRRCHYEVFLVTHIVLSIMILITMFYHVEIFNGEWNGFIYPCICIWIIDRTIRMLRILAFDHRFWNTRCLASYNMVSNLVRLEVPAKRNFLKARPGTYYYIYVLDQPLYAHQNHPFTMAYVKCHQSSSNELDNWTNGDSRRASRPQPRRTYSESSSESDTLLHHPSPQATCQSLVFLVRPYDGFTSRLAKLAAPSGSAIHASLRVLIEGPYGETNSLHTYPNILFLVGGTGIAVPLSYIHTLLDSESQATNIHVIWAVRDHAFLVDILANDWHGLLKDGRIRLTVHVTQEDENKYRHNISPEDMEHLTLKEGRPHIYTAVEEAAVEAGKGKFAVVACGPAQMADDARRASVKALEKGSRGVDYFEESFKW